MPDDNAQGKNSGKDSIVSRWSWIDASVSPMTRKTSASQTACVGENGSSSRAFFNAIKDSPIRSTRRKVNSEEQVSRGAIRIQLDGVLKRNFRTGPVPVVMQNRKTECGMRLGELSIDKQRF
jgi:hypothetical protein